MAKVSAKKLEQIAGRVHGTTLNVYPIAEKILGFVPEPQSLFELLREKHSLFRCSECSEWQSTDCESEMCDRCCTCDNRINEE